MKAIIALLLVSVMALAGCSAVEQRVVGMVSGDLDVAIKRGEAVLGSDDALVICYRALDKVIKANIQAEQLDNGLLLDAVMRARIIDQVRKQVGAELQKACGEITLEVMMQAARRGR